MTLTDASNQVRKFMELTQNEVREKPSHLSVEEMKLCDNLIREESIEMCEAMVEGQFIEMLDGAADSLFVILFALHKAGIADKFEAAFAEVCRSNLTKLWKMKEVPEDLIVDGQIIEVTEYSYYGNSPRRFLVKRVSDGKVIKSPSYSPANIAGLLGITKVEE